MSEVTIIGAGPAGSAAALMLARAGKGVTLIEQHRFPRDKVCGECVSALGIDVLDRLKITPALLASGAVPLTRAIIHAAGGASLQMRLPRPMLGISRHVLDARLLDSVRDAGVDVRQPARCEGIFSTEPQVSTATCAPPLEYSAPCAHAPTATCHGGISLRIRDLQTNAVEMLGAALLILADGKSALPDSPPQATGDIGIKSHWTNVDGPRDAIELFSCSGCYGGLAAIEGGRWNAAFSVPAERVRAHHGNLDSLFAELLSENRPLLRRLQNATRAGPWLASPLPRFGVRKRWMPGIIPIGNAAAAIEPIGGEGMGLALRSAELAAKAICASGGAWTRVDERRLRRAYESLWRIRRFACRATAMVVSSRNAADAALDLARNNDRIAGVAMMWMGK